MVAWTNNILWKKYILTLAYILYSWKSFCHKLFDRNITVNYQIIIICSKRHHYSKT